MLRLPACLLALLLGWTLSGAPAAAQTLDAVKARGNVMCGVNPGLLGFSVKDASGKWSGFDIDFCRALAAAIFNDPNKVAYVPVSTDSRFKDLRDKKYDVLSRNSTWTMLREGEFGLLFAGVYYYDGQGFLVKRSRKIDTALELNNSKVCVQAATTTEANLADFFRANKMAYQVLSFPDSEDVRKAYDSGQCDVMTSDVSQLYAERLLLKNPDDHVILPDVISKEPLGPVVRQGDDPWFNIVKWTLFAMLNAEELGVGSTNLDEALKSEKPAVKRLVGTTGNYGEKFGLPRDWAARIIRHVGNYGEVYGRNIGVQSKLGIPRGLNQLWNLGGIQYAPPIQ